jgi:hypothetical protein
VGQLEKSSSLILKIFTINIILQLKGKMKREYYSDSIANFLDSTPEKILGILTKNSEFDLGVSQRDAWLEEIDILRCSA